MSPHQVSRCLLTTASTTCVIWIHRHTAFREAPDRRSRNAWPSKQSMHLQVRRAGARSSCMFLLVNVACRSDIGSGMARCITLAEFRSASRRPRSLVPAYLHSSGTFQNGRVRCTSPHGRCTESFAPATLHNMQLTVWLRPNVCQKSRPNISTLNSVHKCLHHPIEDRRQRAGRVFVDQ